jgi:hypothetical protein
MERMVARIGLVVLTAALAACTGAPSGSAAFLPQPRQAQDIGGGGPVSIQDIGGGGPVSGGGGP